MILTIPQSHGVVSTSNDPTRLYAKVMIAISKQNYLYSLSYVDYIDSNLRGASEKSFILLRVCSMLSNQTRTQFELKIFNLTISLKRLNSKDFLMLFVRCNLNDSTLFPATLVPVVYQISNFNLGIYLPFSFLLFECSHSFPVIFEDFGIL